MDGDEEVGLEPVGHRRAGGERHADVAGAGQHHPGPELLQLGPQPPGDLQHHVLLLHAAGREGAVLVAAVAGVDHHHEGGRPGRRSGAASGAASASAAVRSGASMARLPTPPRGAAASPGSTSPMSAASTPGRHQRRQHAGGPLRRHRRQQPAVGLGVGQHDERERRVGIGAQVGLDPGQVGARAARHHVGGGQVHHAVEHRHRLRADAQGHARALGHLPGVAEQAEAGDVGEGVDGARLRQRLARGPVELGHEPRHRLLQAPQRHAPLDGGGDDAGAERLGEQQPVARAAPRRCAGSGRGGPGR